MKKWLNVILLLLTGMISAVDVQGADRQYFRFRFAPSDGEKYIAVLRKTAVYDRGAFGEQVEESISKTKITISKTPKGFILVAKPISTKVFRDGIEIQNPVLSLLRNFVVSYDLDAEGRLEHVYGFETLSKEMKASFNQQEFKALSAILNDKIIIDKEKKEWETRIGSFLGRKVAIGDSWKGTEEYTLPVGKGSVTLFTTTTIAQEVPCGQSQCLKVHVAYSSDASGVKKMLGRLFGNSFVEGDIFIKEEEVGSAEVHGEGVRMVDPQTMMIYSENITRTIKMHTRTLGHRKILTTITETKEYSVEKSP